MISRTALSRKSIIVFLLVALGILLLVFNGKMNNLIEDKHFKQTYLKQRPAQHNNDKPFLFKSPSAPSGIVNPTKFTSLASTPLKPTKMSTLSTHREQKNLKARCEVRYLGCFCKKKSEIFFEEELAYTMRNRRVQDCYEICSKKKLRLAAWSTSHCRCGDLLVHHIPLSPSNKCEKKILVYPQVRCPRDDISVDIYLITKFCEKGAPTKKDLSNHFLGMFKLPPDFFKTAILAPAASQSQVTPVWCYLYCERKEQTLSMVTAANECHCGHTADQFCLKCSLESKATALTDSQMVAVWRTSAQDFRCDLRIFLPPLTSEQIFLISFPGAGNTWMRYLIESATGVFTGSSYNDRFLAAGGFLGEFDDISSGRVLTIKSHRVMSNSSKNIVLIRNPFDNIVAEFIRQKSKSHTALGKTKLFESPEWNEIVTVLSKRWLRANTKYLASSQPLVVYYEDLKQDHVKQMRRVVDFTGFKVNNLEERLLCLQLENTGLFKRPPRKDDFNPYSRDQTELINEYVARLKNYIKEKVTSAPPLPNYEREL
ncbi:sialate:O-sulfotransferase 1-like [Clavelina lepadiformis]|uniref:sialate:O-sulfotransferase 1-like n=1 Tax=Clavelina lepadiformis TaxID=159417 RepID=UPI004041ED46